MRPRLTSVLAAVVFAVGAPHAGAQEPEPGVTIDPDSPSSREYDIPLENARRNAQPGRDRDTPVPQGQRVAPLFGEGITSPEEGDAEPGDAGGVKSETKSKRRSRARETPDGEGAGPPSAVRLAVSNPGAPNGGVSTSVLVLAGGALVLGLGAGAGVILRRRASRS